jgi:hypothetical protein
MFSSLHFFGFRPGTNGVTTFGDCSVEVDFRHAPDPLKGYPERCRLVAGLIGLYDYVRGALID